MWFGNWLRLHLTPRRHYSPAHTPNGWYVCIFGAFEVYFDRRLKYLLSIWIQTDFLCHMSSKCPTWHNIHGCFKWSYICDWGHSGPGGWLAEFFAGIKKRTACFFCSLSVSLAHTHTNKCALRWPRRWLAEKLKPECGWCLPAWQGAAV